MPKSESSDNGRVSLSAIDFLGLAKERKVARIDLSAVGYHGVIYVRDLTAAEQAKVSSMAGGGKSAKARFYKDRSYEMDLATLAEVAGPKFLAAAVVTDSQDGAILERAFAADPDAAYITVAEDVLVQMADTWIRETGSRHKMEEMLSGMSNAITNEVVRVVKELSGMVDSQIEEKKENS